MIEKDTVRLLRECDAGAKMGVEAINDMVDDVKSDELRGLLNSSMREHRALAGDIREHLNRFEDRGKDPPMVASAMSWLKTRAELMMNPGDRTVADLMTDGCNMGVKSLSRYLNQYKAADEVSKDIAKRLIALEARLAADIRGFL